MAQKNVVRLPTTYETDRFTRPQWLKHLTEERFLDGVRSWLQGATLLELAQLFVVPIPAVVKATQSQAWAYAADRLREERLIDESATLARLTTKALKIAHERLDQGDPHVLKNGEIVYKPVSAKDAVAIADLMMGRRERLHRQIDGHDPAPPEDMMEHLFGLAQALGRFREYTAAKQVEGTATTLEDDDATRSE